MSSLSTESHEAGRVKKDVPILVILGNPPYSGISSNKGKWITEQIETYKYVDGEHFKERKHWLQDDYVKFIRFSQWKIDQAGEGVLGFITNHSYLDNPTFRGMRQSLMNSFDEIYILDLHGNSLKKEKAPDGSKDENVFDIMQGVAIAFFIKYKKGKTKQVVHQEIYGLRETKYDWLNKHNIKNVKWDKLEPDSPYYFFVKRHEKNRKGYNNFISIPEIFPINVTGIVTARDNLAINFDKQSLLRQIEIFRDKKFDAEYLKKALKISENYQWKIEEQRTKFLNDKNWKKYFTKILYRPFDIRDIYYQENIVFRTRKEVMRHMLEENLGLLICRQQNKVGFFHSFIADKIVEACVLSNRTREINYLLPLYIYPETDKKDLFSENEAGEKKPNIKSELFEELKKNFKKEATPEEIFYYIYAVLYSNTYRTKYAEFLKIDFPRVPFIKDYKLFIQLGKLGKQLADLHLLKSKDLEKTISKFPIDGNNKVEKPTYETEKVWINKEQYFDGVKEEVWKYQIGGYQVCEKWLKDRKDRTLTLDEIKTYCKIVTSLSVEKTV